MFPWQKNKYLILATFLVFIATLYFVLSIDKKTIHLYLNNYHSTFGDTFFKLITNLGDGIFVIIVTILLVFKKIRFSLYSLSVYLVSGIFVQLGKRLIWPDAPRPKAAFDEGILHLIEGVKLHYYHSFPSGHSASAFGLFFLLIFITNNYFLKICFLLCAFLTAYSRVYISQHFLVDVLAGSFIGSFSAILLYKPFVNARVSWFNKSLKIR